MNIRDTRLVLPSAPPLGQTLLDAGLPRDVSLVTARASGLLRKILQAPAQVHSTLSALLPKWPSLIVLGRQGLGIF